MPRVKQPMMTEGAAGPGAEQQALKLAMQGAQQGPVQQKKGQVPPPISGPPPGQPGPFQPLPSAPPGAMAQPNQQYGYGQGPQGGPSGLPPELMAMLQQLLKGSL